MNSVWLDRREFNTGVATSVASLALGSSFANLDDGVQVSMRAGAAETVVTPPIGTRLIGPQTPSTGVNDDLYAGALVLSDGTMHVALVTIDYLGFDFDYNDVLVRAIASATGIEPHNVLINASHNHSAPMTIPWGEWEKGKDKPWHQTLPVQLAEMVKRAYDQLQPASVRCSREATQVGFNRRLMTRERMVVMAPNPHTPVVPWIDVLMLEGLDGRRIATLFSHAAHPVVVHNSSTLVSGDYCGLTVQRMRADSELDGVFMFAQACGGDINAFPLTGGIRLAEVTAMELSKAVKRAMAGQDAPLPTLPIRTAFRELRLPFQDPPSVARCAEAIRQDSNRNNPYREGWETLMRLAESGEPQDMRFPMSAMVLGDQFCLIAMPHEMFAEYQRFVEEISPFPHNMVWGYTNGCECYVATEDDYRLAERGGYEASPQGAAMLYHRRLPLQPSVEKQIKDGIEDLFQDLRGV